PGEKDRSYIFTRAGNPMHKDWQNTMIGRAELGAGNLRLETNSIKRADILRQRIEAACGKMICHRAREHADSLPGSLESENHDRSAQSMPEIPPKEAIELIRQYKEQYYADWTNHPLPALGGKTPRDAIRTKAGRNHVDLLIKDFENKEARAAAEQSFDFSSLRRSRCLEE
ncbi:MAG: DUF2384 domain-containing protein, partial [Deltaproteobacteria bacterium]|nr:DUF2384 domain-containing protein [Deltaproteobacteria bacterium]